MALQSIWQMAISIFPPPSRPKTQLTNISPMLENLFLAAVETDNLDSAIKWEISRGGAEFPHLYDRLKLSDIVWCQPLPLVDGRHKFPEGLT